MTRLVLIPRLGWLSSLLRTGGEPNHVATLRKNGRAAVLDLQDRGRTVLAPTNA